MDERSLLEKLRSLAEETAASFGLALFDLEHRLGGPRWWFRVTLDRADGEVSLEDCERVSKQLSVRLDVEDFIPKAYQIEVSSPGIERPLRGAADFIRFAGRPAKIVLGPGGPDAGLAIEGSIESADGTSVTLRPEGGDPRTVPLERIKSAHLVFTF